MNPNFIIKPSKKVFVYFNFLKSFLGAIVFALFFLIITNFAGIIEIGFLLTAVIILFLIIGYFNLSVAYKKTSYEFYDNKIIANYGTLLTNSSVELVIRNITHVTLVKPFIENKLFEVGNIFIELAGSAGAEGVFLSIDLPQDAYSQIKKVMMKNGFSLKQNKLIQKEKPAIIGVLLEVFGAIIAFILVGLWFVLPTLIAVSQFIQIEIGIFLTILVFLIGGIYLFIHYMDLISRTYYIYDDVIIYYEGFLTKVDSFIPVENLSDSQVTQSLFEKIFDLHDVKISCQGTGHEILFKNLKNGEKMERNIDSLIKNFKPLAGTNKNKKEISNEVASLKVPAIKLQKVNFDENFIYETKMDFKRSLINILFVVVGIFLFFVVTGAIGNPFAIFSAIVMSVFFGVISSIGILITVSCTNYKILSKGISENFDFLNKRNVEFSVDKITGVIFKKNFIDKWFNTFSVTFWSIGSGVNIDFKNIKQNEKLKEKILSKLGINNEEESYRIASKVSVIELLKANIILSILVGWSILVGIVLSFVNIIFIFLPIGLILLSLIVIFYKKWFYSTSKITFTKNYVHFKAGIFFVNEYYSLFDNVKDITTMRYPFSKYGSIVFNVAGESTVQSKNNKNQLFSSGSNNQAMPGIPHAFAINYCEKISTKDDLIDMILYFRPTKEKIISFENKLSSYDPKVIMEDKPSLKNTLLFLIPVFAIFGGALTFVFISISIEVIILIWLILIAIIFWVILTIRVQKCQIQQYRVLTKRGVFYKTQTTIVFSKIDHLSNYQGVTNKIFKNGSILVYTTGSGRPEMIISNINSYKGFYKTLEDFYQ